MESVNRLLSGAILPAGLLIFALFLLIYLKGDPFRSLPLLFLRKKGGMSGRATMMALAGTLGVGNITGVADAVKRAGPGVLFWMWVSSFAAMIVKYAEILLLMRAEQKKRLTLFSGLSDVSGPMLYMRPRLAGALFAISGIFCGFFVGGAMQTIAVGQSFFLSFGLPELLPTLLLGSAALFFILQKKSTLFSLTGVIVPLMSLLYTLLCGAVLVKHSDALGSVFKDILFSAFDFKSAAYGGALSFFTALRFGVIRGLISNEAGCGTAPIAHAHANTDPKRQALFGIIEVGADTLLLCTLTGLTVLVCPSDTAGPTEAVAAALSSVFGAKGGVGLCFALAAFAFATLLCWSIYLDCFTSYLFFRFRKKELLIKAVKVLFCAAACLSPLFGNRLVWQFADFFVAVMTLINLFFLFSLRKELK